MCSIELRRIFKKMFGMKGYIQYRKLKKNLDKYSFNILLFRSEPRRGDSHPRRHKDLQGRYSAPPHHQQQQRGGLQQGVGPPGIIEGQEKRGSSCQYLTNLTVEEGSRSGSASRRKKRRDCRNSGGDTQPPPELGRQTSHRSRYINYI